jgi:hypothetical protein
MEENDRGILYRGILYRTQRVEGNPNESAGF